MIIRNRRKARMRKGVGVGRGNIRAVKQRREGPRFFMGSSHSFYSIKIKEMLEASAYQRLLSRAFI